MKNLKPTLVSLGVNYTYIIDNEALLPSDGETLHPSTAALHWSMQACSINRIFSEVDLREFLFRLPIVLDALKVLTNWFGYDELFTYQIGEKHYTFSVDDIFRHYGIEICDSLDNHSRREHFLDDEFRSKTIRLTKFVGLLGGVQILPFDVSKDVKTEEITVRFSKESDNFPISEKLISDAEFFAEDVLKLAHSDLFDNQGRFQAKYDEIELRKKEIASIPKFDLSKIPTELRVKCMSLMFDPKWVESCQGQNDEDYIDEEKRFIYLAWLFANGLIVADSTGWLSEVEGVELNLDDYELDDGGTNLHVTYDIHNIMDVEFLLDGVLFKD